MATALGREVIGCQRRDGARSSESFTPVFSMYVISRDRQNLHIVTRWAMAMSILARWRPARASPTMPARIAPIPRAR
jgi:hypothetical protein